MEHVLRVRVIGTPDAPAVKKASKEYIQAGFTTSDFGHQRAIEISKGLFSIDDYSFLFPLFRFQVNYEGDIASFTFKGGPPILVSTNL